MAQRETVTLVSPDGREYQTDQPAEVTELVTSYGYRRKRAEGPAPAPAPAEVGSESADEPEGGRPEWTDAEDD